MSDKPNNRRGGSSGLSHRIQYWSGKVGAYLRPLTYLVQRPEHPEVVRYQYQRQFLKHNFSTGQKVLDVGSGGDPFPHATVLADRYLNPTHHRTSQFKSAGKPVVISDINHLPFANRQFDYVVCAHVLEHVDDPVQACRELQRVGKAGYIETPTLMKDTLFSWAKGMHKWYLMQIANRLVFFEYSERKLEGIGNKAWRDVIYSPMYHPLQRALNTNIDLFNLMFEWEDHFNVTVMWLDGTVEELNW